MRCPKCGNQAKILDRCFRNLEAYHRNGGSVLAHTGCCNAGVYVRIKTSFLLCEYEGERTTDDWGIKIENNENKNIKTN